MNIVVSHNKPNNANDDKIPCLDIQTITFLVCCPQSTEDEFLKVKKKIGYTGFRTTYRRIGAYLIKVNCCTIELNITTYTSNKGFSIKKNTGFANNQV